MRLHGIAEGCGTLTTLVCRISQRKVPVRSYQSRPTALVRNSENGAAVRQASV